MLKLGKGWGKGWGHWTGVGQDAAAAHLCVGFAVVVAPVMRSFRSTPFFQY